MTMTELQEIEDAIRRHEDPVVTVGEIVEAVEDDVSDTHVRDMMRLLERDGAVESKQTGARAVAWWHTDRVTAPILPPEDHQDQSDLSEPEPRRDESEAIESDDGMMDPDAGAVEQVETPAMSSRDEFETAAFAAFNHLRDTGSARKSDFVDALHDEYPAGYDNARTWWRRVVKPALDAHPEIETPAGGNPWRFR